MRHKLHSPSKVLGQWGQSDRQVCFVAQVIQTVNSTECVHSVSYLGFACVDCVTVVRGGTEMKTRELSIREKRAIVKLREDGKLIWKDPKTAVIAPKPYQNKKRRKK